MVACGLTPCSSSPRYSTCPSDGPLQAGDDAQQGALAAARGPQQGHKLAFAEGQVDILHRGEAPFAAAVHLAEICLSCKRSVS